MVAAERYRGRLARGRDDDGHVPGACDQSRATGRGLGTGAAGRADGGGRGAGAGKRGEPVARRRVRDGRPRRDEQVPGCSPHAGDRPAAGRHGGRPVPGHRPVPGACGRCEATDRGGAYGAARDGTGRRVHAAAVHRRSAGRDHVRGSAARCRGGDGPAGSEPACDGRPVRPRPVEPAPEGNSAAPRQPVTAVTGDIHVSCLARQRKGGGDDAASDTATSDERAAGAGGGGRRPGTGAVLPAVPAVAVAAGVTAAATAASVATAASAHAQSGQPVLVLVQNGETNAPETALLQAAGYSVTQATPSAWAGLSTAQFEGYAALVIGDPSAGGSCSSLLPTTGTSGSDALGTAWQAAVNGNVAVLGTAPALPGTTAANSLITDSAGYAAAGWNSANSGGNTSGTGLYVSLNCEYATAAAGTDVSLLDGVEGIGTDGGLTVQGKLACSDPGTVNTWEAAKAGTFTGFSSSDLAPSAWGTACPVQEAFGSWPAMFTPVAYDAASDATANFTASDGTAGQPYVLLGTPISSATAALAPSEGGEVLGGTTSGGTSNQAAPGVNQAAAGDPVNTENGDFAQSSTDLSLPGFGPGLSFTRTYDAQQAQLQTQTGVPGPLGYGWTDNWTTSLSTARPTPGDIYAADGLRLDSGDGGLAVNSLADSPEGVYWDSSTGDVYFADTVDNRIQEIPAFSESKWGISNMVGGDVYTVAGQADGQEELPLEGGHGNGLPATSIVLNNPRGITMDPEGDLIIADSGFQDVVEIAATSHTQWGISMTAGDAYVIAGQLGQGGLSGLGGPATSAELEDPTSVHMGAGSGVNDLYIADGFGNRILVMPGENESAEWGQSG